VLDHAAVAKALGAATGQPARTPDPVELPEPLASVVDYLGEDLDQDSSEFVPTAELAEALDIEPTELAREMGELECRPTPAPNVNRGRGPPGPRLPRCRDPGGRRTD
jgi:DNA segregation ATPase FtsK/SpoIIIE, S-DNA-T family